jgi:NAD(P)-dependent dehydrogenase (short-subunit alcohol dehydrogenase family)
MGSSTGTGISGQALDGKVALITGGARGIGLSVAYAMAGAGARVILADLDEDAAAQAAQAIGPLASAARLDLASVESCRSCIDRTVEQLGQLDILVNNGGICHAVPIPDVDQAFYDRMFDINVRGAFFCSQAAAVHMKARQTGRIITIASIAAKTGGTADVSIYAATKASVVALTKAFAKYLAPYGTANAILPGPTDTALFRGWASNEQADALLEKIPLARLGRPGDHAGAALFLASPAADYITGSTIDINGGMLMD